MLFFSLLLTLLSVSDFTVHYPSISPDGSRIAFSCFGDIWVVDSNGGTARRLTVSNGYESMSRWSPDGKWIAYESDEWGNDDIYVASANDPIPSMRLTYHSRYDRLLGWTPDSKEILFRSSRYNLLGSVYSIDINGETPEEYLHFDLLDIEFLDSDSIIYSRGISSWWRKRYRGPANWDLWIKELPEGNSRKITEFDGRDGYPMYSEHTGKIYFLSNRGDNQINNIWKMDINGENPEQVTEFSEEIHYPSISRNGKFIVFTSMGSLYRINLNNEDIYRVNLSIPLDYKEPVEEFINLSGEISEFSISPDESEIAFIIHGEIFIGKLTESGKIDKIKQVTDTYALEKDVSWHPDDEKIIYSSLQDGDYDIYTARPENEKKFHKELIFVKDNILNTGETEYKPEYSPDGNKISFLQNSGQLMIIDSDGNNIKSLTADNDILWKDWSPDSRWITYSRTALEWREDIFVVPIDRSIAPFNISNHPNDDYKPMWSSDGRRISYASRDNTGNLNIKYVFLFSEDENRTAEYWEEEFDSLTTPEKIEIDFTDILERIHTVTELRGGYNYISQSSKGELFAIHAEILNSDDIWAVRWTGDDLIRLTTGDVDPKQIYVSKDSKTVYYITENGNLSRIDVANQEVSNVSFSVELKINHRKEFNESFIQAWWMLNDGFYDSEFHGVDWREMKDKYSPLASSLRTTKDFHSVVEMLMGELNASHLGIWKSEDGGDITGCIGIIPDDSYKGAGIKIKSIIPGSPASKEDTELEPGEIIEAVNGREIGSDNFYKIMRRKNDTEVKIRTDKKELKIKTVTPYRIRELIWKEWPKMNKRWVEEESDDRIGYLYIPSMSNENLERFKEDLYKLMNKDGLIIDIRYNGGGNIHDELLNILRRTTYIYSKERGDTTKTPISAFRWDKPVVLLINEYCYSDAEIFPMGFKELELGTVVGVPTFGAVIGTSNYKLMDGSTFRIPSTGWFRKSGLNLENNPVQPDVYVNNPPEQYGDVPDRQLKKALEIILKR